MCNVRVAMHDFCYQNHSSAHIPCIALLLKDEIKQNRLRRHLHQRKARLWGVEETLKVHVVSTRVQSRTLLCFSPQRWQCLPVWDSEEQPHLLMVLVWMLTMCAENAHYRLLPLDIYGWKTVPLQRLLLLRLAKQHSWFSYIQNSDSLLICI